MDRNRNDYEPGDVFQINDKYDLKGWVGAFVLATETNPWGIKGFVAVIYSHNEQRRYNIRLKWGEIEFIGSADLVPQSVADKVNG